MSSAGGTTSNARGWGGVRLTLSRPAAGHSPARQNPPGGLKGRDALACNSVAERASIRAGGAESADIPLSDRERGEGFQLSGTPAVAVASPFEEAVSERVEGVPSDRTTTAQHRHRITPRSHLGGPSLRESRRTGRWFHPIPTAPTPRTSGALSTSPTSDSEASVAPPRGPRRTRGATREYHGDRRSRRDTSGTTAGVPPSPRPGRT